MASTQAYPGLGSFDTAQRETVRLLWDRIHALEGQSTSMWRGNQDAGGRVLRNLGNAVAASDALSQAAGDLRYGAAAIRPHLQIGGAFALNVEGLRGVLADAQRMGITVIPSALTALPSAELYSPYQVVTWRTALYYMNPLTVPASWVQLITGYLQLNAGTLNPDTKPTLTAADAGYLFVSTDFNRIYRWDGAAWADFPGSEPRGVVVASYEPTVMPVGWALCDGTAVEMSTPLGGVVAYTPPDLMTAHRFIRFDTTEGATGGAETVSTPGPTGVTGLAAAAAGADFDVAADDHIHAAVPILPPYMTFVPYMRM